LTYLQPRPASSTPAIPRQAVLEAGGGQLRDDATALCLDWHGGPPRDRDATSGANREGRAHPGAAAARSPEPAFENDDAGWR
jgi:hypothetical protein